jgi:hypothetical protein
MSFIPPIFPLLPPIVPIPESFMTIHPLANTGGPSIFRLAIYDANHQPVPGSSYIFPISPQGYTKKIVNLSTFFDTPGRDKNNGVNRIVDLYGTAPPVWTFKGTTGYQLHNLDAFAYTGFQSLKILFRMIEVYSGLQVSASQTGRKSYILELDDYYNGDFYEVVPLGPQNLARNETRPIIGFYDLNLVGIRSVSEPDLSNEDLALLSLVTPFFENLTTAASNGISFLTALYGTGIAGMFT